MALEDWDSVVEFLSPAWARVAGNAQLASACDRAEGSPTPRPVGQVKPPGRCAGRSPGSSGSASRLMARTREQLATVVPAPRARSLLEAALATYERLACAPRGRAARAHLGALA